MRPRISHVRPTTDFEIELGFTDGQVRLLNLRSRIEGRGGVFIPLQDPDYFRLVDVDHEAGTIVWPNGVDFCPDVLNAAAMNESLDSSMPMHEVVRESPAADEE